jgi:hypothetical protein
MQHDGPGHLPGRILNQGTQTGEQERKNSNPVDTDKLSCPDNFFSFFS